MVSAATCQDCCVTKQQMEMCLLFLCEILHLFLHSIDSSLERLAHAWHVLDAEHITVSKLGKNP